MKKIYYTIIGMLGIFAAISCSETNVSGTEIILEDNIVEIAPAGGIFSIAYTGNISDPLAMSVSHAPDWLYGFDFTGQGVVRFLSECNRTDARRQHVIDIIGPDNSVVGSFAVLQNTLLNEDGLVGNDIFGLEVTSIFDNGVRFNVESRAEGLTYYLSAISRDQYDKYSNVRELHSDIIKDCRKAAAESGISLEEYLGRTLRSGSIMDTVIKPLAGGSEYSLFVFGMDADGELTSEVRSEYFTTTANGKIDARFEISYSIEGPEVTMSVVPDSDTYPYVFNVYKLSGFNESTLVEEYQKYIDQVVSMYAQFGMSVEDVIKQIASVGPDAYTDEFLADTQYAGFAIAITIDGTLNSDPSIKEFKTGLVGTSDNDISINVTDIQTRQASLSISTTNSDKYVFGIGTYSQWAGYGDSEIIESIIASDPDISEKAVSGDINTTVDNLIQNTEYMVFAFGYYGGVITTPLEKYVFTTLEEEISDVEFHIILDKYFDGDEVADRYPQYYDARGTAVMPGTVDVSEDVQEYHYHIFEGNWLDEGQTSDADIIQSLLTYGLKTRDAIFYVPFDTECTLLGVAVDNRGNYGRVHRQTVLLDRNGVSSVDEFVPLKAKPMECMGGRPAAGSVRIISDGNSIATDGEIFEINYL